MLAKDPEYLRVIGATEERLMTLLDEYKLNENYNCTDDCFHDETGTLKWASTENMHGGKSLSEAWILRA